MAEQVEQRNGEYYVAGTRIPLECVALEFQRGSDPESICNAYPLLTPKQVRGAIAYYLDHQAEMDEHFQSVDEEYERFRAAQKPMTADLRARLESAREQFRDSR